MTVIDSQVLERHGIKPDEYERILQLMGREPNLLELGIVDSIIDEPPGGAHQDYDEAARLLDRAISDNLSQLSGLSRDELREDRYQRFRRLGAYIA